VPFTSVHTRKYRTDDKLKTDTLQKLNTTQKKANNAKYSKTKLYPGLVASYDTQPGNEVGLFYNTPEPTLGHSKQTVYLSLLFHQHISIVQHRLVEDL